MNWVNFGRDMYSGEQDIKPYYGGYVYAGNYGLHVNSNKDMLLHFLNNSGDTVKTKSFGDAIYDEFPTRILLFDTAIYVVGYGGDPYWQPNYSVDYKLAKLDTSGNVLWMKRYGGARYEYTSDLILNTQGNLVIAGASSTYTTAYNTYHPYIFEVTKDGDSIRSKSIVVHDRTKHELTRRGSNNFIQTSDGGYAPPYYINHKRIFPLQDRR